MISVHMHAVDSSITVGIVADDFTSAMDAAAPFAAAGRSSVVALSIDLPVADDADVLAVDCDTRWRDEADAEARVARAVVRLDDRPTLLKTIDSTLRGHLGAELSAARRSTGRERVVVAPAFPAEGRTTVAGRQQLDGAPVGATADLHSALRLAPGESISLRPGQTPTGRVAIYDGETEEDLDACVAALDGSPEVLWVGSPGLARALARRHARATPSARPRCARRVLTVIGSQHRRTRAQAEHLLTCPGVHEVHGPDEPIDETARILVLRSPLPATATTVASAPARRVARELARVAAAVVTRGDCDAVIASGGDTAREIAEALDGRAVRVCGELAPGVALGTLIGPHPVELVTKGGGLGSERALVELADRLLGVVAA